MSLSRIHSWITAMRYRLRLFSNPRLLRYLKSLKILTPEETIDKVLNENLSISRFGDGEFYVLGGRGNQFQNPDPLLASRLKEVLSNPLPGLLVCIQRTLQDFSGLRLESLSFAVSFVTDSVDSCVKPFLPTEVVYGDSLLTRFYMAFNNKGKAPAYFQKLRRLWKNQKLLIVEGSQTRLGVGNDCFDNVLSIRRILCPNENAFSIYDRILNTVKVRAASDELIILSLGMTATVLAYDLCRSGHRALDLGHIDIEYEWMLMGAESKCAIPGKRMTEVADGKNPSISHDIDYQSQIIDNLTA